MDKNAIGSGFFNINKPAGIMSHDVVARVRRVTGWRRVGHAGTLDPFATGVLLVGINAATQQLAATHVWPKTYEVTVRLGATSDTDDVTGKIVPVIAREQRPKQSRGNHSRSPRLAASEPRDDVVQEALRQFTGTLQQVPPAYAAIKVRGKKLYEYARAGQVVERRAREVTIHSIELLAYAYPDLRVRVVCSTGTYLRALARDLGERLGTGGYAAALTRTAIGPFTLRTSVPLAELTAATWRAHLVTLEQFAALF